jgi:PAS domain S-box-containing protein
MSIQVEGVFQTMAEHAPALLWVSGRDLRRSAFNQSWLAFTGRTPEQESGEGWLEGVHPEDREKYAQSSRVSLDRREPFEVEYRLRHHDGAYRWLLDRAVPFTHPDSDLGGYVGACFDITEGVEDREQLKEREAALTHLTAELERRVSERTKALESFTYSVSHDLKAPLRTILGYAKILEEDYAPAIGEEGRQMLARQTAAARRMERLIDDLLDASRLDRRGIDRTEIDLTALARDVASEICNRDLGCEVRFDIAEGLRANADVNLVRYVIQNLFDNAVKYSRPSGTPSVTFGRSADGSFFVRDNGVGFDMKYANKLFQPFERLHNASEFPGSGIGLSNVEKIVHRHGGSVWAESAPNQGATFFFTLG